MEDALENHEEGENPVIRITTSTEAMDGVLATHRVLNELEMMDNGTGNSQNGQNSEIGSNMEDKSSTQINNSIILVDLTTTGIDEEDIEVVTEVDIMVVGKDEIIEEDMEVIEIVEVVINQTIIFLQLIQLRHLHSALDLLSPAQIIPLRIPYRCLRIAFPINNKANLRSNKTKENADEAGPKLF